VAEIKSEQAVEQAQAGTALRKRRTAGPHFAEAGKAHRFRPGQSGNPGGRTKGIGEFRVRLSQYDDKAEAALIAALDDPDGRVRLAACREFFDRRWGKPVQAVTDADGKPLQITQVTYVELLQRMVAGSGR
jgi:hypothetical protein